jgi:hypothetical protein
MKEFKKNQILLGSLSIASYDSQGLRWKYSNPPARGKTVQLPILCSAYEKCVCGFLSFLVEFLYLCHSLFNGAVSNRVHSVVTCLTSIINVTDQSLDRLCGLVVRVSGYRSGDPGFDSRALQKM